ncbi:hypothetical protein BDN70DRAFT_875432 [Pholiota conissans]|uniref:Xylanolytic transcriptional activator regulatory domain-containing protein n=1 Tax=Pholiota conissans TaxID=109636 RepID=A0A9P6D356_9AGAR|nr:hypothetical protein BDN70DRAFT_875432 [Pholiota conissans]
MLGKRCTNCQTSNVECTHNAPREPKKSEKRAAYIQSLEEKVKKADKMYFLLQKVYPGQDIDELLDAIPDEKPEGEPPDTDSAIPNVKATLHANYSYRVRPSMPMSSKSSQHADASDDPSEEDDLAYIALAQHLNNLSLGAATDNRYFGQASVFMFVKDASHLKSEITGSQPDGRKYMRETYWNPRRHEIEYMTTPMPPFVYPEENLLRDLVLLYFEKVNPFFPLLHKPTFWKMLIAGQHHWDQAYGMTVLLVCALGARYSHDPRVLVPGTDTLSSGWQYFVQVPIHRNIQFYRNTLYDLQYYALACMYVIGIGAPHASWSIIGFALRCALEKGAHRRKSNSTQKPTVEDELLKRAFWCLIFFDRIASLYVGRPFGVQDEDYDVDYPIECDDEYWEPDDAEQAFKQPSGKPSTITAFVRILKLFEILAFALRTLYSTRKSKILSGLTGDEWENRIVAELDSSMNKWKDSLPQFLRWDPEMTNSIFFHQSVSLHVAYYYIQIQIHRPFLTKKSSLSFPSLAICTNAARSSAHVLEVSLTRGTPSNPIIITGSLITGTAISLILWGSKRSGMIGDPAKDVSNFQICLNVLQECAKRWHVGGRAYDMLNEVSFLHEYKSTAGKRRRDSPERTSEISTPPNPRTHNDSLQPLSHPHNLPSVGISASNLTPIATVHGNESWNATDLMFAHMGYVPDFAVVGPESHCDSRNTTHADSQSQQHVLPANYYMFDMHDISQSGIGRSAGEQLTCGDFSLWSDIPIAFSVDEWNRYLVNLRQH